MIELYYKGTPEYFIDNFTHILLLFRIATVRCVVRIDDNLLRYGATSDQ